MRVLFIGDVVGSPGRRALSALLPSLRGELTLDVIIANGENAANGRGLTLKTAREMFDAGVDIISSGNHIWDQREIVEELDSDAPILRPANYPPGTPGRGILRSKGLTVLNLQGRTFMSNIDCPFRTADAILAENHEAPIFVDMHAEATSEKQALGWYLDGRVAAVLGSHTHVPTADARILPCGTAYISDAGFTGARDSVLGFEVAASQRLFLSQLPTRLPVEEKCPTVVMNSVLVEIDDATGRSRSIQRVDREHTF
ncbi:MAG TPA: TIGR00282 family metallophosphoesterase [Dehalococcoidia bacterium]